MQLVNSEEQHILNVSGALSGENPKKTCTDACRSSCSQYRIGGAPESLHYLAILGGQGDVNQIHWAAQGGR
jgi:hypothetical protein